MKLTTFVSGAHFRTLDATEGYVLLPLFWLRFVEVLIAE
jgi:hypothetical protein